MTRSKSIIGALLLCALSICAFGASSASAVGEHGLTAVKCVEVGAGNGKFNNSNCFTPESAGGAWDTVELAEGVSTEVEGKATKFNTHETGNTENPVAMFKGVAGGFEITVTCGKAAIAGKVTNVLEGTTHRAHGTEGVVTYTECHESKTNEPTKICKVQGTEPAGAVGEIKTNKLTTTNIGVHHEVEIKPEAVGGAFVKFNVLKRDAETPNCVPTVNVAVSVTGSVIANAETSTHSHLTITTGVGEANFKANGAAAQYQSTQTGWMKGNEAEPVGLTTVTPTE